MLKMTETLPALFDSQRLVTSKTLTEWLTVKIRQTHEAEDRSRLQRILTELDTFPDIVWKLSPRLDGYEHMMDDPQPRDDIDFEELEVSVQTACGLPETERSDWSVTIWPTTPDAYRPQLAVLFVHKNVHFSLAQDIAMKFASKYGSDNAKDVVQTADRDHVPRWVCRSEASE